MCSLHFLAHHVEYFELSLPLVQPSGGSTTADWCGGWSGKIGSQDKKCLHLGRTLRIIHSRLLICPNCSISLNSLLTQRGVTLFQETCMQMHGVPLGGTDVGSEIRKLAPAKKQKLCTHLQLQSYDDSVNTFHAHFVPHLAEPRSNPQKGKLLLKSCVSKWIASL